MRVSKEERERQARHAEATAALPQRVQRLEEHLAELQAAPEPNAYEIESAERVLGRWKAELAE